MILRMNLMMQMLFCFHKKQLQVFLMLFEIWRNHLFWISLWLFSWNLGVRW
jgi:hypothetical protein